MAYNESTTSYSGRKVDLLMLSVVKRPAADIKVEPDVVSDPRIVSGIEKMAQRYAHLFLTSIESVAGCASEGTSFMTLFRTGKIYDEATLKSAAAAANKSVLRQMKAADKDLDTPEDEALDYSEVEDTSIDRTTSTALVKIKLTAESGDTYTYVTPLATGI